MLKARKQKVRQAFKTELNLIIDCPSGAGNSLSRNVARKAFLNPVTFSQVIGVSPMLVSNLCVIWQTLASKPQINNNKYGKFCQQTLDIYLSEVGWFNFPPTLHKILVHGSLLKLVLFLLTHNSQTSFESGYYVDRIVEFPPGGSYYLELQ